MRGPLEYIVQRLRAAGQIDGSPESIAAAQAAFRAVLEAALDPDQDMRLRLAACKILQEGLGFAIAVAATPKIVGFQLLARRRVEAG